MQKWWKVRGTKFVVEIGVEMGTDKSCGNDTYSSENVLGRIHVLVAEDNELNWEVISEFLDIYGITSERAENGQICIDMLNAAEPGKFDLVLMDVQMPVLNGKDAVRKIRISEREDIRKMPVIAMTADAFAEDIKDCLNAGMNAHIAKPINIDKLRNELRKVLTEQRENNAKAHSDNVTQHETEKQADKQVPLDEAEIFSYEKLNALFDSDETVKKLLESFLTTHKDDRDALGHCLEVQNYEEARPILHSLIGVSGNFCLQRLCEVSKKLRLQVHAKDVSCFDEFSEIWDKTITELYEVCERLGQDDCQNQ